MATPPRFQIGDRVRTSLMRGLMRMRPLRRERHQHLMNQQWESAAALAWQGYDTLGRGALVVQEAIHPVRMPGISGRLGAIPALYIPATWTPTRPDRLWEMVIHIITIMAAAYDPDNEVVCIFVGRHGELSAYRMLGPPFLCCPLPTPMSHCSALLRIPHQTRISVGAQRRALGLRRRAPPIAGISAMAMSFTVRGGGTRDASRLPDDYRAR